MSGGVLHEGMNINRMCGCLVVSCTDLSMHGCVIVFVARYSGIWGLVRDDEHGCPIGCKRLERVESEGITRTDHLASNEQEFREGQALAVHKHATEAMQRLSVKHQSHQECFW